MCVADLTNKLQTSLFWGIDNSLSLELHTPPLRLVEKERKQSNNVSILTMDEVIVVNFDTVVSGL